MVERFHPRLAVACSFQKEASVVLDLILKIAPDARVFTLDTHVLFPETYETWRKVEERYGITVEVHQGPSLGRQASTHGDRLWERDPDACCDLRKVQPLQRALADVDAWISGVRREQGPSRAEHPQARLGRQARALEGQPARRLDRGGRLALHRRPRPPVQRAARSRLRLDRLHPLHAPRHRAATGAGPARARSSAACTPKLRTWTCSPRSTTTASALTSRPGTSSGSISSSRPTRTSTTSARCSACIRSRSRTRASSASGRRSTCTRTTSCSSSTPRGSTATGSVRPIEVHVYVARGYLITARRDACEILDELRDDVEELHEHPVYKILDTLTDAFYPVIEGLEERVDALEAEVAHEAAQGAPDDDLPAAPGRARDRPHRVGPARPVPVRVGRAPAPGRVRRHRASTCATSATTWRRSPASCTGRREDLAALTSTYFNANADRLNAVATRITILGTLFVLWTLVTGFFGQNFGWLVDHIDSMTRLPDLRRRRASSIPTVILLTLFWVKRHDWF